MAAGVNLESITKAPQPTLQILGILLDLKLHWRLHMKCTCQQNMYHFVELSEL